MCNLYTGTSPWNDTVRKTQANEMVTSCIKLNRLESLSAGWQGVHDLRAQVKAENLECYLAVATAISCLYDGQSGSLTAVHFIHLLALVHIATAHENIVVKTSITNIFSTPGKILASEVDSVPAKHRLRCRVPFPGTRKSTAHGPISRVTTNIVNNIRYMLFKRSLSRNSTSSRYPSFDDLEAEKSLLSEADLAMFLNEHIFEHSLPSGLEGRLTSMNFFGRNRSSTSSIKPSNQLHSASSAKVMKSSECSKAMASGSRSGW